MCWTPVSTSRLGPKGDANVPAFTLSQIIRVKSTADMWLEVAHVAPGCTQPLLDGRAVIAIRREARLSRGIPAYAFGRDGWMSPE